jgi:hypothetical protein
VTTEYQNVLYKVKFCHPFWLTGCFLDIFTLGATFIKNDPVELNYRMS